MQRASEPGKPDSVLAAEPDEMMRISVDGVKNWGIFPHVFQGATDGMLVLEPHPSGNPIILAANDSFIQRSGYTLRELVGKPLTRFFDEKFEKILSEMIDPLMAGETVVFETVHQRSHCADIPVELTARIIRSGDKVYIFSAGRDISSRKKMEQELRQSQKLLFLVNAIAKVFLTVPDAEMYSEVLSIILNFLKSKIGVFGYIDESGALVCPSMTRDVWEKCQMAGKNVVFPPETWGGIWGRCLKEKKAEYTNDSFSVPKGHIPVERALSVPIIFQEKLIGMLMVGNRENDYGDEDQKTLEKIASQIAPILNVRLQRDREEKERRRAEQEVQKKNLEAEQNNLALKGVLSQIEQEKNTIRENVALNMNRNIRPLIEKLKRMEGQRRTSEGYVRKMQLIKRMEDGLNDINSDCCRRIRQLRANLTSSEVRICHMIKSGYRTKEIAEMQSISVNTVNNHSRNIRKKIGLSRKKVSLKTFLNNLLD